MPMMLSTWDSNARFCPPVCGDSLRALASELFLIYTMHNKFSICLYG